MLSRFPTIVLFLLLCTYTAVSQAASDASAITGVVIDRESGEPIPTAVVRLLADRDTLRRVFTGIGALTDESGAFSLPRTADSVLLVEVHIVSHVRRQVPVGDSTGPFRIELYRSAAFTPTVSVSTVRRSRSVEDACCRVESIRDEVQQHAPFSASAVDVLRRYSSCTSTRISCALDNSQSVRLRGLEPTYISVLVDGLPAVSGFGTFYGLGILPSHALQTVSIAEGASSGLYGNGAVSGVIDLQTRPPTEVPELIFSGNAAGEPGAVPEEFDLNVSYTGMMGEVGVAAFGSYNSRMHGHGALVTDYDRAAGLLKTNMMLGNATELTLSALLGREVRAGGFTGGINERVGHLRGDFSTRLDHTFADGSELRLRGLVSRAHIDGRYGQERTIADQNIIYLSAAHLRDLGSHALTVGAEVRDDALEVELGRPIGYKSAVGSLYAQDEVSFGDKWSALASLRYDHHSAAGGILSPRGALRFAPVANMTMRVMAGQGFKAQAHFDEAEHRALHGGLQWRQNPEFDFERSFTLNYDISYSFTLGENFGVDANFNTYHTMISGKAVAQRDSLAAGTLYFVNSDHPARLRGIELQLRPTWGRHLSGSIALAAIDYRMRDASGAYQRVALAPAFNADASLMYRHDEMGLVGEVWGSFIGEQRLERNPSGAERSPAYALVNARVEKHFGNIAVFAGMLNILHAVQSESMPLVFPSDTGYDADHIWGPTEGREAFAGVRVVIGG